MVFNYSLDIYFIYRLIEYDTSRIPIEEYSFKSDMIGER